MAERARRERGRSAPRGGCTRRPRGGGPRRDGGSVPSVMSGVVGADESGLVALDRALRDAADDASAHRRLVAAAADVGADVDSVRRALGVFESWCLDRAGDMRVRLVLLRSYL